MKRAALPVLVLALTACGGSQVTHSPSTSAPSVSVRTPKGTPSPPAASSGYPQEAADKALCTTYQTLIQSGDSEGIRAAVAKAGSTVTTSLATDMLRAANGTSFQQDEQNQVYVAMDCGIVAAGRQPVELRSP
jgi:hypothetical protein